MGLARLGGILFALFLLTAGFAAAQSENNFTERLNEIEASIDDVEAEFSEDMSETRVTELRTVINNRSVELTTLEAAIETAIKDVDGDLDGLGPKPEGEAELPSVAKQRRDYNSLKNELTAQKADAAQLSERVTELQTETSIALRDAFFSRVLKREPAPYMSEPSAAAAAAFGERMTAYATRREPVEGAPVRSIGGWFWLIVGGILLIAPAFLMRDMISNRLWEVVEIEGELAASRAVTALIRALRRIIVAAIALFILVQASAALGLFGAASGNPALGIALGIFYVVVANALSVAILSPRRSAWRLVRLNNADAMQTYRRLRIGFVLTGLYVMALVIFSGGDLTGPLANAVKFVGLIVFALYFVYIARVLKPGRWRLMSYVAAVFLAACALFGYFALGNMGLGLITNFSVFLAGLYVMRQFLRNWAALAVERLVAGDPDEEDKTAAKSVNKTGDAITFWTGAGVDALLLIAAAPIAMALAGMPWSEIWAFVRQFLIGFEIFNVRLSPINIVYGLLIFIALLLATRLFQRVLSSRILPQAGVEAGLRNTLSTLFGYVGLVVATFVAVNALGVDFTGLAIIAGALSLGIGIGLQAIVGNFVSGLILLLERPIKIDDWVVTNSGEGRVKNINVRSTEIETFDKCSIIVPNTELITSAVSNWTHKDRSARITVPVGVAYDSDPNQVRDILYSVLDDVPGLLRYPEPYVYFKDFGDSSLDMELRVFVREATEIIRLRSELRYKVFAAFKKAGIEIPFPQRDINFRNAMPGAPSDASDTKVEGDAPLIEGGGAGGALTPEDMPTGVRPKASKSEPVKVDIEKEVKTGQDATPDEDGD